MIAQPVARILICIPRRPARPGHRPTFGPDIGRPAPAPGRMLKAVVKLLSLKDLANRQPINKERADRPQRKGVYIFPKAHQTSEKEVCDPDVWRNWVLLHACRDKLVSALLPAFLGFPTPIFNLSCLWHQAQGSPKLGLGI